MEAESNLIFYKDGLDVLLSVWGNNTYPITEMNKSPMINFPQPSSESTDNSGNPSKREDEHLVHLICLEEQLRLSHTNIPALRGG